jgi:flagellar motor switch protein FliG
MKLKGGVKEAAKMLQGLDPKARKSVLEQMIAMNPELAEQIRTQMVTFEDLQYITPSMMRDLMRKIDMDELALALRGTSPELINKILGLVSTNVRKDMEEILKGKPQPMSKVQEAQDKIMEVVLVMVDKGELVLSPGDDEEYV